MEHNPGLSFERKPLNENNNVPLNSPNRPRNSFRSSSTLFRPFSINASNFTVKAVMRWRKSSKLNSTRGSCVSGLSEYAGDIGAADWDCEVRKEDVLAEKFCGAMMAAIAIIVPYEM